MSKTHSDKTQPPQLESLIEMVKQLEGSQSESLLAELKKRAPELAEALQEAMFSFDDLVYVTDRGMQILLKEIDRQLLLRALKQTSDELMEKVLSNLSRRAAQTLQEELDILPPLRLSDVKEAQRDIAKLARQMEERGKIIIVRPHDHDPLV